MKPLTLILALLTASAQAQDAPTILDVDRAEIWPNGATMAHRVRGGVWMSDEETIRTAKRIELLEVENEALRNQPPPGMGPALTLGVVGLVVGAVVGGWVVATARR